MLTLHVPAWLFLLSGQCHLNSDRGFVCGEYVQRWYYNGVVGACLPFWYGGCGGNRNRFASETECLQTCGKPSRFFVINICVPLVTRHLFVNVCSTRAFLCNNGDVTLVKSLWMTHFLIYSPQSLNYQCRQRKRQYMMVRNETAFQMF